jgi:hypothetical protein
MALKINDNGVNRDMTDDEIANLKTISDQAKANAEALAAKQAARQAVLDKLGLTADEANALLG